MLANGGPTYATVKDISRHLIKDNKILIAQQAVDDPLAGLWSFPVARWSRGEPRAKPGPGDAEEFCIGWK